MEGHIIPQNATGLNGPGRGREHTIDAGGRAPRICQTRMDIFALRYRMTHAIAFSRRTRGDRALAVRGSEPSALLNLLRLSPSGLSMGLDMVHVPFAVLTVRFGDG